MASQAENVTYVYERYQNPKQEWSTSQTASIEGDLFPSGDVLAEFKAMAEDWREEIRKDPQTGKSYVDITFTGPEVNTAKHWLIQVDLETKLPIRTAVWFNEDRQGPPHYEFTKLEYDPDIPEGYFDFTPPAGRTDHRLPRLDRLVAQNSNVGTSVDQLGYEEACKKVIAAYWKAVIAKDWNAVQTLRPLATGKSLADLQAVYAAYGSIEQASISRMNHLNDPGTFVEVFCILRMKDGSTHYSLLNVALQDTPAGRIGVVAGSVGPEFYDVE